MKIVPACIGLFLVLASHQSCAQPEVYEKSRAAAERNRNLELQIPHGGYVANSLEDLVAASPVIIRGRWGKVLERGTDFGYGVTREDIMARTGATEATIHMYGLPYAHYEIEIDEVIKGEGLPRGAATLTVAGMESPEAIDVFTWLREFRGGEHLFFLDTVIDDDLYRIRGEMFDLRRIDSAYMYRGEDDYATVFGSEDAQQFLETIEAIVAE